MVLASLCKLVSKHSACHKRQGSNFRTAAIMPPSSCRRNSFSYSLVTSTCDIYPSLPQRNRRFCSAVTTDLPVVSITRNRGTLPLAGAKQMEGDTYDARRKGCDRGQQGARFTSRSWRSHSPRIAKSVNRIWRRSRGMLAESTSPRSVSRPKFTELCEQTPSQGLPHYFSRIILPV